MSWRLPIISTFLGAEGINFINRKSIVIVNSKEEFESKIITMLNQSTEQSFKFKGLNN